MKPVNFKESNIVFGDNGYRSHAVADIVPLPVMQNSEQIVTRWKLSWTERFEAFSRGHIWLQVLTTKSHPPVCLSTGKTVFVAEAKNQEKK